MPIHDLGYRKWQGLRSAESLRWTVIATTGIRIAWKSNWLRRMLIISWLPAAYMGVMFFAFEQYVKDPNTPYRQTIIYGFVQAVDNGGTLQQAFEQTGTLADKRPIVWRWLLMNFFRLPQGTLLVLIVGMLAPPLIANDVRSKGFLLYFSRPLSRIEYICGKMGILWAYLALITTLPALALYALGVLLSPDLSVIGDTWDLPLRIIAASIALMVPTTSLALMLSSTTAESRYAGFAWFTIWAMGFAAWTVIRLSTFDPLGQGQDELTVVSLYHSLGSVQQWIFGLQNNMTEFYAAAVVTIGVTIFSLTFLFRRVSAPMRI